jgi:nitronate monooxygenase
METPFTALVGCSVPIQQAPMGAVSSPDLAVAVADAGGVGTVSALGLRPHAFLRLLDGIRGRTSGVLSANVVIPDVDEGLLADLAARVRLVDFFWFDPARRLVERVHRAGALVNWQVGSVAEARDAVDAGCDVTSTASSTSRRRVRRGVAPRT